MSGDKDMASGDATGPSQAEPEWAHRFWSKVERRMGGDCWAWTAGKNTDGYGIFHLNGRDQLAHRVALQLFDGSIPAGKVVDHICRNRACVNRLHLRVVERSRNVHENSNALAHLNSLKTHCPQGHEYAGDNLIERPCGRRVCRSCRAEYHRKRRAA